MALTILETNAVTLDLCERCWRETTLSRVDISELKSDDYGFLLCDNCIKDYSEDEFTCNCCSRLATRDCYTYCDDCY